MIALRKKIDCVGMDLFRPYSVTCKKQETYVDLIRVDIRFFSFQKRVFDAFYASTS